MAHQGRVPLSESHRSKVINRVGFRRLRKGLEESGSGAASASHAAVTRFQQRAG